MTRGDDEDLTAGRAGGVGPKPGLDARHVEAMATLREYEDLVSGGELGQADRALGGELGGRVGREGQLRERL